jgi:peptidoglycan/LPS O-acetylase OafA/YrhL
MTSRTSSRQLPGLDLIRFSAAAMVMVFHIGAIPAMQGFTWWGWVGVEIFFVLSGFVIAYTASNTTSLKFLRNRIVRLAPGIWLCGTVTAVFWLLVGGIDALPHRYLNTLILWPVGPWVDPVYWTLPVEVVFYAAIFTVLSFKAYGRLEVVLWVMTLASAGYLCAELGAQLMPSSAAFSWTAAIPDHVARLTLLVHGVFFALGAGLWLCFFDRATRTRLAMLAVCALGCIIQIAFSCRAFAAHTPIAVPELVWLAAMGAVVLSVWQNAWLNRYLGRYSGAIRLLGLATYPLYLLHDKPGVGFFNWLLTVAPVWVAAPTAMAATVAASLVMARYLEPAAQAPLRTGLSKLQTQIEGWLRPGPSQARSVLPPAPDTPTSEAVAGDGA